MARNSDQDHAYQFEGFCNPTTTQVPDVVFDTFLSRLGEAELKALLYIIRRTFGFKKDKDHISFNQFIRGVLTKEARHLDDGCGIRNRTTLSNALKSLERKGIVVSEKSRDVRGDNDTTTYRLRFRGEEGVVRNSYQSSTADVPPVVRNSYPQQTVLQKTEKQQHDVVVAGRNERSKPVGLSQNASKHDPVASDRRPVISALAGFGLTRKAALELAERFPSSYLLAKLEAAKYLVASGSALLTQNPPGFLRRSIEEDWPTPKGLEVAREQESARRVTRQLVNQMTEQSHRAEQIALGVLKRARKDRERRIPVHDIEGSRFTTKTAWSAALRQIRQAETPANYSVYFTDTHLLSVGNGQAIIAAANTFAATRLQTRFAPSIERTLLELLGRRLRVRVEALPLAESPMTSGSRPSPEEISLPPQSGGQQ